MVGIFKGADAVAAVKVGAVDADAIWLNGEMIWPTTPAVWTPAELFKGGEIGAWVQPGVGIWYKNFNGYGLVTEGGLVNWQENNVDPANFTNDASQGWIAENISSTHPNFRYDAASVVGAGFETQAFTDFVAPYTVAGCGKMTDASDLGLGWRGVAGFTAANVVDGIGLNKNALAVNGAAASYATTSGKKLTYALEVAAVTGATTQPVWIDGVVQTAATIANRQNNDTRKFNTMGGTDSVYDYGSLIIDRFLTQAEHELLANYWLTLADPPEDSVFQQVWPMDGADLAAFTFDAAVTNEVINADDDIQWTVPFGETNLGATIELTLVPNQLYVMQCQQGASTGNSVWSLGAGPAGGAWNGYGSLTTNAIINIEGVISFAFTPTQAQVDINFFGTNQFNVMAFRNPAVYTARPPAPIPPLQVVTVETSGGEIGFSVAGAYGAITPDTLPNSAAIIDVCNSSTADNIVVETNVDAYGTTGLILDFDPVDGVYTQSVILSRAAPAFYRLLGDASWRTYLEANDGLDIDVRIYSQ